MAIIHSSRPSVFLLMLVLAVCGCGIKVVEKPKVAKKPLSLIEQQKEELKRRVDEQVAEGKKVIPQLLTILKSSSGQDQLVAAEALGKIGVSSDEVIEGLGGLLNEPDISLQLTRAIATAMGQLGPGTLPHLIKALAACQSDLFAIAIAKAIDNLELQPENGVELVLARQSVEKAQDEDLRLRVAASRPATTRTVTKSNALGDVVEQRQYTTPGSSVSLANSWDEAFAAIDSALAKIGINDEAARKKLLSDKDQAALEFNSAAWQELRVLEGGSLPIIAIVFNKNGSLLASADSDGVVRIVRTNDGKMLHEFVGAEKERISALAFNPWGDIVASGGDKVLRLWNVASGESRVLNIPVLPRKSVAAKAITFLKGGEVVVAACTDGNVHYWNIASGEPINKTDISQAYSKAAFSDAGGYLGVVSDKDQAVFQVTESEVKSLPCEAPFLTPFSISSNGSILASRKTLYGFSTMSIIDLANGGKALHEIDLRDEYSEDNKTNSACLALTPNGELFADGLLNGEVHFWSTKFGRLIHSFSVSEKPVMAIRFSTDGKLLATGDFAGVIKLWGELVEEESSPNQLPELKIVATEPAEPWKGETVRIELQGSDPDGDLLRYEYRLDSGKEWQLGGSQEVRIDNVSAGDHSVEVRTVDVRGGVSESQTTKFHVNSWKQQRSFEGYTFALSPDNTLIATLSRKAGITLWNVKSGEPQKKLKTFTVGLGVQAGKPVPDRIVGLVFSPDGTQLIAVGSQVHVWNSPNWTLVRSPRNLPRLDFDEDKYIKGTQIKTTPITSIAFVKGSGNILIGGTGLRLIDLKTRKIINNYYTTLKTSCVVISPDGTTVAAAFSELPILRSVSLKSFKESSRHSPDRTFRGLRCIAYSPKGDVVLTGSHEMDYPDGGVRIWDAKSLELKQRLVGTPRTVTCLAFSPDGKLLAIGSETGPKTGHIQVWDFENLRLRTTLDSETRIGGIAFSANGSLIATADSSSAIKIWAFSDTDATDPIDPITLERTWIDSTGEHKIVATFASFDGEKVTLKKSDGTTTQLPISRLSQKDQTLIREYVKSQAEKSPEKD